jgi:solute carrier family 10 (sodium/bile acid cotransporter), member 7
MATNGAEQIMSYGAVSIDGGSSHVNKNHAECEGLTVAGAHQDPKETTTHQSTSFACSACKLLLAFCREQEFMILVVLAVFLAWVDPNVGPKYLYPQITATWLAVVLIFLCTGLSLKTEEFRKAFMNWQFNAFCQGYNFLVVSSVVYGVSRGLEAVHVLSSDLADGMVVCASLPMAINMLVVLTKAGNGDEATAVFNATASNLLGVFLSPVLIPLYLGVRGDIALFHVFYNLTMKAVLPVIVGQVLQRNGHVNEFVTRYKSFFKLGPQYCLIFIIYNVFCRTFLEGSDSSMSDVFLMIAVQFLLLTTFMVLAWYLLGKLFRDKPKLRVTGLFACTHKTVSIGVPLIGAMYEDNPSAGMYTLPLLIWFPMQLLLGSLVAPHLVAFVQREEARLRNVEAPLATEERSLLDH